MRVSYRTTADLPHRIPVFPLVGAMLLPRAPLPLNIFEPRFLSMVDDCMRGERVIGMIQPEGDGGSTGSPTSAAAALVRVGCAGRITTYQEQDDGRLLISLTGLARFTPLEEATVATPYRVFDVDYADFAQDLVPGAGEDEVDRKTLLATLKRYLEHRQATADWGRIEATGSEQLVNFLALGSPFGPKEKQALLEAPTLKERAQTLITLAEMELAGAASGSGSSGGGRLQ